MRDAAELLAATRRPPQSALAALITPARYLQLRRVAAGLSIDQAALLIAPFINRMPPARAVDEARDLIRMLETPGVIARWRETIEALTRAIPLDPDVYFQLATDPGDRHPAICNSCGCSAADPCYLGEDHLCRLHPGEPAICSRCSSGEWL